jgi:hypothetical protein
MKYIFAAIAIPIATMIAMILSVVMNVFSLFGEE